MNDESSLFRRRDLRTEARESESRLTAVQQRAIAALLTERTIGAAAKQAGVGESTLRRWLTERDFEVCYLAARSRVVEEAVSALQAASRSAVECLERSLTCGQPSVEVRAATAILDRAVAGESLYLSQSKTGSMDAWVEEYFRT